MNKKPEHRLRQWAPGEIDYIQDPEWQVIVKRAQRLVERREKNGVYHDEAEGHNKKFKQSQFEPGLKGVSLSEQGQSGKVKSGGMQGMVDKLLGEMVV